MPDGDIEVRFKVVSDDVQPSFDKYTKASPIIIETKFKDSEGTLDKLFERVERLKRVASGIKIDFEKSSMASVASDIKSIREALDAISPESFIKLAQAANNVRAAVEGTAQSTQKTAKNTERTKENMQESARASSMMAGESQKRLQAAQQESEERKKIAKSEQQSSQRMIESSKQQAKVEEEKIKQAERVARVRAVFHSDITSSKQFVQLQKETAEKRKQLAIEQQITNEKQKQNQFVAPTVSVGTPSGRVTAQIPAETKTIKPKSKKGKIWQDEEFVKNAQNIEALFDSNEDKSYPFRAVRRYYGLQAARGNNYTKKQVDSLFDATKLANIKRIGSAVESEHGIGIWQDILSGKIRKEDVIYQDVVGEAKAAYDKLFAPPDVSFPKLKGKQKITAENIDYPELPSKSEIRKMNLAWLDRSRAEYPDYNFDSAELINDNRKKLAQSAFALKNTDRDKAIQKEAYALALEHGIKDLEILEEYPKIFDAYKKSAEITLYELDKEPSEPETKKPIAPAVERPSLPPAQPAPQQQQEPTPLPPPQPAPVVQTTQTTPAEATAEARQVEKTLQLSAKRTRQAHRHQYEAQLEQQKQLEAVGQKTEEVQHEIIAGQQEVVNAQSVAAETVAKAQVDIVQEEVRAVESTVESKISSNTTGNADLSTQQYLLADKYGLYFDKHALWDTYQARDEQRFTSQNQIAQLYRDKSGAWNIYGRDHAGGYDYSRALYSGSTRQDVEGRFINEMLGDVERWQKMLTPLTDVTRLLPQVASTSAQAYKDLFDTAINRETYQGEYAYRSQWRTGVQNDLYNRAGPVYGWPNYPALPEVSQTMRDMQNSPFYKELSGLYSTLLLPEKAGYHPNQNQYPFEYFANQQASARSTFYQNYVSPYQKYGMPIGAPYDETTARNRAYESLFNQAAQRNELINMYGQLFDQAETQNAYRALFDEAQRRPTVAEQQDRNYNVAQYAYNHLRSVPLLQAYGNTRTQDELDEYGQLFDVAIGRQVVAEREQRRAEAERYYGNTYIPANRMLPPAFLQGTTVGAPYNPNTTQGKTVGTAYNPDQWMSDVGKFVKGFDAVLNSVGAKVQRDYRNPINLLPSSFPYEEYKENQKQYFEPGTWRDNQGQDKKTDAVFEKIESFRNMWGNADIEGVLKQFSPFANSGTAYSKTISQSMQNMRSVYGQIQTELKQEPAYNTAEAEAYYARLDQLSQQYIKSLDNAKKAKAEFVDDAKYKKGVADLKNQITGLGRAASLAGYDDKLSQLMREVNDSANNPRPLQEWRARLADIRTEINANLSPFQKLELSISNLMGSFSARAILNFARNTLRRLRQELWNSVKEVDKALTNFQIVSGQTDKELNKFSDDAFKSAKKISASFKDIVDAATVFNRLGYNTEDSLKLSEMTTMFSRLGDIGIGDAENAATAVIKAFNMDTDELQLAMDKMVLVGNNFPISASQIGEALNNASSALAAGGNNFDQSIALLTAANTTVQDASKASTALRTITARMRNTKAELEDLGEEVDTNYDTTAKYRKELLALAGVDILNESGGFRSTYEVLDELSSKWGGLSDQARAAITTQLAGVRNVNVFSSIMENFDEARKVMDEVQDATGFMAEKYEAYTNSVEASLSRLKTSYQEFSSDILDSDLAALVIDALNGIVVLIDYLVAKPLNMLIEGIKTLGRVMKDTGKSSVEAFEDSSKALEDYKQEVEDLEEKVKDNLDTIKELQQQQKDNGYVQSVQDQIDKLVVETGEYEKQLELLRQKKGLLDYNVAEDAYRLMDSSEFKYVTVESRPEYDNKRNVMKQTGELTEATGDYRTAIHNSVSTLGDAQTEIDALNTQMSTTGMNFDEYNRKMLFWMKVQDEAAGALASAMSQITEAMPHLDAVTRTQAQTYLNLAKRQSEGFTQQRTSNAEIYAHTAEMEAARRIMSGLEEKGWEDYRSRVETMVPSKYMAGGPRGVAGALKEAGQKEVDAAIESVVTQAVEESGYTLIPPSTEFETPQASYISLSNGKGFGPLFQIDNVSGSKTVPGYTQQIPPNGYTLVPPDKEQQTVDTKSNTTGTFRSGGRFSSATKAARKAKESQQDNAELQGDEDLTPKQGFVGKIINALTGKKLNDNARAALEMSSESIGETLDKYYIMEQYLGSLLQYPEELRIASNYLAGFGIPDIMSYDDAITYLKGQVNVSPLEQVAEVQAAESEIRAKGNATTEDVLRMSEMTGIAAPMAYYMNNPSALLSDSAMNMDPVEWTKLFTQQFGTSRMIDLLNRPGVSAREMQKAGWEDFNGAYATLYSSAYTGRNGELGALFTPIMQDKSQILAPSRPEDVEAQADDWLRYLDDYANHYFETLDLYEEAVKQNDDFRIEKYRDQLDPLGLLLGTGTDEQMRAAGDYLSHMQDLIYSGTYGEMFKNGLFSGMAEEGMAYLNKLYQEDPEKYNLAIGFVLDGNLKTDGNQTFEQQIDDYLSKVATEAPALKFSVADMAKEAASAQEKRSAIMSAITNQNANGFLSAEDINALGVEYLDAFTQFGATRLDQEKAFQIYRDRESKVYNGTMAAIFERQRRINKLQQESIDLQKDNTDTAKAAVKAKEAEIKELKKEQLELRAITDEIDRQNSAKYRFQTAYAQASGGSGLGEVRDNLQHAFEAYLKSNADPNGQVEAALEYILGPGVALTDANVKRARDLNKAYNTPDDYNWTGANNAESRLISAGVLVSARDKDDKFGYTLAEGKTYTDFLSALGTGGMPVGTEFGNDVLASLGDYGYSFLKEAFAPDISLGRLEATDDLISKLERLGEIQDSVAEGDTRLTKAQDNVNKSIQDTKDAAQNGEGSVYDLAAAFQYEKEHLDESGKTLEGITEEYTGLLHSIDETADADKFFGETVGESLEGLAKDKMDGEFDVEAELKYNVSPSMAEVDSMFHDVEKTLHYSVSVDQIPGEDGGGAPTYTGTANAYGTAYVGGKWGSHFGTHKALVGELGQELMVDPNTGTWRTIGDHGPEIITVPDDAIIFNDQQTKGILAGRGVYGRGTQMHFSGNAYGLGSQLKIDRINKKTHYIDKVGNVKEKGWDAVKKKDSGGGGSHSHEKDKDDDLLSDEYKKDKEMLEHQLDILSDMLNLYHEGSEDWFTQQANIVDTYTKAVKLSQLEYERLIKEGYDASYKDMRELAEQVVDWQTEVFDAQQEYWEAQKENATNSLEYLDDHIGAIIDLKEAHYDLVNAIQDEEISLRKEMQIAKDAYPYLTDAERMAAMSSEDYAYLLNKLSKISKEASGMYEDYLKQIEEVGEDASYELDRITEQMEQQYDLKMKEYATAKAELGVLKARKNLENVMEEKSVATLVGGMWVWTSDSDEVKAAMEELADAELEYAKSMREQEQGQDIATLENYSAEVQAQIDAIDAAIFSMDDLAKEVHDLKDAIWAQILANLSENGKKAVNSEDRYAQTFADGAAEALAKLIAENDFGSTLMSAYTANLGRNWDAAQTAAATLGNNTSSTDNSTTVYIGDVRLDQDTSSAIIQALRQANVLYQV